MTKRSFTATALILATLAPQLALAAGAGCPYQQQASACAAGMTWDSATRSCVATSS